MTAPHSPTSPDDTTRKTDVNLTHVAAAALAAVTSAVLGSELGAAGTLIGAAGASVITTVGTALYQASLERSRTRVRSLAQRGRSSTSPRAPRAEPLDPGVPLRPTAANAALRDKRFTDSTDHGPYPRDRSRRFTTLRWGAVIVGTLAAFLLAMIAITGFEWANGGAVGGNGKGTTIGQVINDQPSPRKPASPSTSNDPGTPASETPTETTEAPGTATSTMSPDGGASDEHGPAETSVSRTPSGPTPTPPPLIRLPGVGG